MQITANAEKIGTFNTFRSWVNEASELFGRFRKSADQYICLDKNGNTCTIGKDFMAARDNNLFPVEVYRLVRTSEEIHQINSRE